MTYIAHFITSLISHLGYGGVVLLMAIESACVPLPSEVILPFSGYLVATGRFELGAVAFAGALGCNLGSMVGYGIGYFGGRPLALHYGRRLWISPADLDRSERWVRRRGNLALFVGRLLPVVRTFIALPAGVTRMRMVPFHFYTFAGSLLWCFSLAWLGERAGQHWQTLSPVFHRFDLLWSGLLAVLLVLAVWHHASRFKSVAEEPEGIKVGKNG